MLGAPLVFNLIFSHYLRSRPYKKKYLLFGIYLRSASFLGMAATARLFGLSQPLLAVYFFFLWVFLFSISAGFAGIAYADLLGKTLPRGMRARLYAVKQFFSSLAAFAGGLIITGLFQPGRFAFPENYTISLLIGCAGLAIASVGFYLIKEPAIAAIEGGRQKFSDYIRMVPAVLLRDQQLHRFIVVENMASFSVMILPFYMIMPGRPSIWMVPTSAVTCIAMGALIPLAALLLARTNPIWYSLVFFLLGFIIILPILGGLFINLTGYTVTFILVSLIMLTAALRTKPSRT